MDNPQCRYGAALKDTGSTLAAALTILFASCGGGDYGPETAAQQKHEDAMKASAPASAAQDKTGKLNKK